MNESHKNPFNIWMALGYEIIIQNIVIKKNSKNYHLRHCLDSFFQWFKFCRYFCLELLNTKQKSPQII